MAKTKKLEGKRYIVNSGAYLDVYGTSVRPGGINIALFEKNPVMFYNHDRSRMPIGRWGYIANSDGVLMVGDPIFHEADYQSMAVCEKVEEGFIQAVSMRARKVVFDPAGRKTHPEQQLPDVVSCELLEVSFTDIPVDSGSTEVSQNVATIMLCEDDGNELKLSDPAVLQRLFPNPSPQAQNNPLTGPKAPKTMDKVILTELSLSENATDAEVLGAIKTLKNKANPGPAAPGYAVELVLSQAETAGLNPEAKEPLKKLMEKAPDETVAFIHSLKLSQGENYQGGALGAALHQLGGGAPAQGSEGNKPASKRLTVLELSQKDRAEWDLDRWEKEDPKGIAELNLSYPEEYQAILTRSGYGQGLVLDPSKK